MSMAFSGVTSQSQREFMVTLGIQKAEQLQLGSNLSLWDDEQGYSLNHGKPPFMGRSRHKWGYPNSCNWFITQMLHGAGIFTYMTGPF